MFKMSIASRYMALALLLAGAIGCSRSPNHDLFDAALNGRTSVAKALLAQGADSNAKDDSGVTVLMLAAGAGHTQIVDALLAKGADCNAKAGDGVTALMLAANKGHTAIVKALLAKGADCNAKSKTGATVLSVVAPGHSGIVALLKQSGAKE